MLYSFDKNWSHLVGHNFSLVRNIRVPTPRVILNLGKRNFFDDHAMNR